jgi:FAD-linked sulfhydryl oxidase
LEAKAAPRRAGAPAPPSTRAVIRSPTSTAHTTARRARASQLHTVAAYFPDQPTTAEKQAAMQFLRAFPTLYPCKDCAEDMANLMEEQPPRVESRKDFSLWMCELHNHVNEQVGKAPFKCELKALDEAWRHASKACEEAQAKASAASASASRTAI